jgi:hypothetical protein
MCDMILDCVYKSIMTSYKALYNCRYKRVLLITEDNDIMLTVKI